MPLRTSVDDNDNKNCSNDDNDIADDVTSCKWMDKLLFAFLRAASSVILYFFVRTRTVYNQFNKCKTLQRVNAIPLAFCLIHFLNGIFSFLTILVQLLSILTFKWTHFMKDLEHNARRAPTHIHPPIHRHTNTQAYFGPNKCQSDMMLR